MNNFDHRVSLLFQNPCRPCPICQVRFIQTPKPEAYQYYLANDFFFSSKMAHREENTCLHSITAARYRRNKNIPFLHFV